MPDIYTTIFPLYYILLLVASPKDHPHTLGLSTLPVAVFLETSARNNMGWATLLYPKSGVVTDWD